MKVWSVALVPDSVSYCFFSGCSHQWAFCHKGGTGRVSSGGLCVSGGAVSLVADSLSYQFRSLGSILITKHFYEYLRIF